MNRIIRLFLIDGLITLGILIAIQSSTPRAMAIPAFARKYHTSCSTCHSNWPQLNDFGRAFKINGFKFPKDDEDFLKEPPLMLGWLGPPLQSHIWILVPFAVDWPLSSTHLALSSPGPVQPAGGGGGGVPRPA